MPANGTPNGRFELPQFTPLNYSLTDGTDIPAPPDSPIEEKAPPTAPKPEVDTSSNTNGAYDGRGRTSHADQPPLSPTSVTRPSSIRRFLSRKSLNSNYTNGTNTNKSHEDLGTSGIERPTSSLSHAKRSSSWFRRLGSGTGNKRTSVVYENGPPAQKAAPKGPPPPKLPELNQLKAKIADDDEGSLGGGDLFKNIK